MAFLTCHFYSHALYRNTTIQVILPSPASGEPLNYATMKQDYGYADGLPVVYLLHGLYGDCTSWPRYSNIDRYAQERRCAVVMASAGDEFYQNMRYGQQYVDFFTKELPAYICALFPVSGKRENTFIAGLSMGGYGAWHLALAAPQVYSKAASMSGALDIESLFQSEKISVNPRPINWKAMFGDVETLKGSDSDLFAQYDRCVKNGCVPKLYQTCGTSDILYPMNLEVRNRMQAVGADLTYHEAPGIHDWNYWDGHIQEVLDWFLERRAGGSQVSIEGAVKL